MFNIVEILRVAGRSCGEELLTATHLEVFGTAAMIHFGHAHCLLHVVGVVVVGVGVRVEDSVRGGSSRSLGVVEVVVMMSNVETIDYLARIVVMVMAMARMKGSGCRGRVTRRPSSFPIMITYYRPTVDSLGNNTN